MPFTQATMLEDAEREVQNKIYKIANELFEGLEHAGLIHGNGHHAAQELAAQAKEEIRRRWRVYPNPLSTDPE